MSVRKPSLANFSLALLAPPDGAGFALLLALLAAGSSDGFACVTLTFSAPSSRELGSCAGMGVKWWVRLLSKIKQEIDVLLILLSFYTVRSNFCLNFAIEESAYRLRPVSPSHLVFMHELFSH